MLSCASTRTEYLYDDPFLNIPEFGGIEFSEQVEANGGVFTPNEGGGYVVIFLSDYIKFAEFVLVAEAEKKKYENWQKKLSTK